ncbi:glycoside hydrolase family 13 protein [Saccharospirillum salsuginis]|uniref:Alpha-glucosidase n=1 Tax=Saccharospirillum salsuginis TaxID=418750 RepID=A0A918N702_9GAMM|nr:alpha-glucosidase [Saccharospirillum salsuginis]GGX48667.1 alpha-glucosidase [Saccharospirillum salsuginis]
MQKTWWKEAVVYQIYPRSFMDSNGDGIGDLSGIIAKLDYLKDLGVDVLWLSPIFPSPNDDNGYDISDYQGILDDFGTMEDFDRLLFEAHQRGLRILLDLVINHTSDEHPWFQESRSSKDNPKRDWYFWREGKKNGPPNNWESIFSESVWCHDDTTDEYYLHLFSRKQPDLNWDNHDMRAAVYDMIRWWLDKGVDGFRIDAITHLKKTPGLPDMPNPDGRETVPSTPMHLNADGIQDYIADLCESTFAHYDIMTVGEANGVGVIDALNWVGEEQGKFNMLFQFEQLKLWGSDTEHGLNLPELKKTLTRWQQGLDGRGWNALFVENHDIPRIVSTWGDPECYWRESATAIATLYFLMQGTPFIYQGQELGMTNYPFSHLDQFDDVAVKNLAAQKRREGWTDADILAHIQDSARDHSRTPMQWTADANAGFTTGTPWLAINPNHTHLNADTQKDDPDSVLNHYKALIRLRREEPGLVYGRYDLVLDDHPSLYAYRRTDGHDRFLVLCNLTDQVADFSDLDDELRRHNLLLANYLVADHTPTRMGRLRPFEARVYRL